MKKLFLILLIVMGAEALQAQSIAKNEPSKHEITSYSAAPQQVVEYPSYKVSYYQNKKGRIVEVFSPKPDNGDLKLVNTSGMDVCTIHKGLIHEGKNVFPFPAKKISCGTYYVVSKLSSGEQFADRVVIGK
jgi:hypothetical protein